VSGLDPKTGSLEWSVAHASDQGVNVATPVWGGGNLLFVSSAYNGGSRVLRLSRPDGGPTERGKVKVEEIWANRRVRVHFGNAVRIGTRVFASNGDFGAAPFTAIDITTGDIVWRDRSVPRSTLIAIGRSLLILDEDGTLALATPNDTGLMIQAKAAVLSGRAWTAPTLSGTTVYLRDLKQIVALELGK
jgi:PQQ-like domain